jgi:predicted ATPase
MIEGLRVQNFRVLRDVTLGRLNNQATNRPLTPLIAVIGKNGSGKSTLFDAFVFLKDCFSIGVVAACNKNNRGGFERLRSPGCNAPIRFEFALKLFAYLLLLESPTPPQFICIEEPENGLYHKLLEILVTEFRNVTQTKQISQFFITTHQPYFVDALSPEETWLLEKGPDGFSNNQRASDNRIVKAMVDEGLPLGSLWYSDYLDAR